MNKSKLTISSLIHYADRLKDFHLELLTPNCSLEKAIPYSEINRPGLNLVGFYKHFAYERIQIFGQGEYAYLMELHQKKDLRFVNKLFEYEIPLVIFSHSHMPPQPFLKSAEKNKIPVFSSKLSTAKLTDHLYNFFQDSFFSKEILNGVMMEIFGIGVLIEGDAGIGKKRMRIGIDRKRTSLCG